MLKEDVQRKLLQYQDLLLKWNKTINLISRTTERDIWNRHILDSSQIYEHIDNNDVVCDLGSGAGLPGIILSIMGVNKVMLIESDSRKCAFLNQAALLSNNKIYVINERIENLTEKTLPNAIDIVTSRALCKTDQVLKYGENLRPKKGFLLLKGANYQKELDEAEKNWHFESEIVQSTTNFGSSILKIKNARKKN